MRDNAKPLRTMMYVPGNKEDWVRKAPKYGADALIIDLEDSVPPNEKPIAREIVSRLVPELASEGVTLLVRVNDMETGLTEEDVSFAVQKGTYGITLPMTRGPEDVKAIDELITSEEKKKGIERGSVLIDPGLETATGMRSAYDVGISSERVAHMGAGGGRGGDIARAIGYRWTAMGTETLFIRSKVLLDSRAAGVPYPMTGLWQDIQDHEGLRTFANHSRDLGYNGMTVIHPSHVPIVNEIFSPSREEIEEWQGLVEAMRETRESGGAAVSYQGGMVDIAHEKTAVEMLEFAGKLGLLENDIQEKDKY
ncbi:MAG: CoA ester lyase [Chloroflexota bacterium]|jgi:citrate lyase subunit beta/citryl-CoA lyase|nr:CoA ester lyase [Chloroflexota bacterium]MEC9320641.1 CoA ester lyase [Chloroflexota bacterium]